MPATAEARPVGAGPEAERVIANLSDAMAALEAAMEHETRHLAAGRLREGLAGEGRKAELAAAYLLALRHAKANIVALARFVPGRLKDFRLAQSRFEAVVERNQTVIATARAVSEGLIRSLAAEVERDARPTLYGPRQPGPVAGAGPLVFSAKF